MDHTMRTRNFHKKVLVIFFSLFVHFIWGSHSSNKVCEVDDDVCNNFLDWSQSIIITPMASIKYIFYWVWSAVILRFAWYYILITKVEHSARVSCFLPKSRLCEKNISFWLLEDDALDFLTISDTTVWKANLIHYLSM